MVLNFTVPRYVLLFLNSEIYIVHVINCKWSRLVNFPPRMFCMRYKPCFSNNEWVQEGAFLRKLRLCQLKMNCFAWVIAWERQKSYGCWKCEAVDVWRSLGLEASCSCVCFVWDTNHVLPTMSGPGGCFQDIARILLLYFLIVKCQLCLCQLKMNCFAWVIAWERQKSYGCWKCEAVDVRRSWGLEASCSCICRYSCNYLCLCCF